MEFCEAKHTQPAVENVRLELLLCRCFAQRAKHNRLAACKPLHFVLVKVEVTGFEPAISWSQTTRDSQTSLHFVIRDEAIFMFIKQSTFLQNNTPEAVYMGTIPSEFLRVQVMFSQSENYPVFILRIKTWQAATPCPHRPIIKSLIHFSRSFLHPTGACSVRLAGNAELKPQK